jgi:hypothetical protein
MVYCNTLASQYDVQTASDHIDILTHNRIWQTGWDSLTQYQKRTVSRVCEKLAIFEYDNRQALSSPASSLSLGSVSMSLNFDTDAFHKEGGVVIPSDLYALLLRTGLCCRII